MAASLRIRVEGRFAWRGGLILRLDKHAYTQLSTVQCFLADVCQAHATFEEGQRFVELELAALKGVDGLIKLIQRILKAR
jgi:hypothetical protein